MDPEKEITDERVAKRTGLPVELLRDNPDVLEHQREVARLKMLPKHEQRDRKFEILEFEVQGTKRLRDLLSAHAFGVFEGVVPAKPPE